MTAYSLSLPYSSTHYSLARREHRTASVVSELAAESFLRQISRERRDS